MSQGLLTLAEIQEIENEVNSSFYFLDLDVVERNFHELWDAFRTFYPNTQLAYSFKTNYAPKICQLIRELGGWAEVVSEMEYEMAAHTRFPPEQIIVNGPLHNPSFVEKSLLEGATVNLDSWYLLDAVSEICRSNPDRHFRVGIRLTFPVIEAGFSRFGIEATADNMKRLREWENSLQNCTVAGFHSHFSNSSRSLKSFASRADQMIEHTNNHFENRLPDFINMGGGLQGKMPESLAVQFKGNTPDYHAYAETVGARLNAAYGEDAPTLYIEPGTAIVADAMDFVCKVHEVKRIEDKTYALVNGSNHNINHKWGGEALPIQIYRNGNGANGGTFDIVGNTCIEKDVMRKDVAGPIAIGDYIAFEYTGGYTNVLKQPFIHPCQPIYGRRKGELFLVKRPERTADILATYLH